MKVLVCVKRVSEPGCRPRLTAEGQLDASCLRHVVNPYDELALDTASELKASGAASEVVAVAVGSDCCEETLLSALARGADRAVLVQGSDELRPEVVAPRLAEVVRRESPDLVLIGRLESDTGDAQTGPRLAGVLVWPLATAARGLAVEGRRVRVTRDAEEVTLPLPAVVTVDGGGRTPRLLSLYDIAKATHKPQERITPSPALPPERRAVVPVSAGYESVPERGPCHMAANVDELLALIAAHHGASGAGGPLQGIPDVVSGIGACHYVGTEEEADALAWIAGRRGMPLVAGVTDAWFADDRHSHPWRQMYKRQLFGGRLTETVRLPPSQDAVVIVHGPARTEEQKERTAALLAAEPLPVVERKPLPRPKDVRARPDLATARIVVAGGRALKTAEEFERLVGGLADALGGAVAASGGATNGGIAPPHLLVGQSGKAVAPDLYIALGISGVDQHVGGIRDARTVVAINSDPRAPIFEFADYGLVADVGEVVPQWIARLW